MLKPRPTIAGRHLNVIVSRETLDRLRVVTVDDTSINTRNTPPHHHRSCVPVTPGHRTSVTPRSRLHSELVSHPAALTRGRHQTS